MLSFRGAGEESAVSIHSLHSKAYTLNRDDRRRAIDSLSALAVAVRAGAAIDAQPLMPKDGDYIGLREEPEMTRADPGTKWFHENRLVIRNGEAILDLVPMTIHNGHRGYGGCDGGYLTYRGRFISKGGRTVVTLRLFQSAGLVFLNRKDPYSEVKTYLVKFASHTLEIEGVIYKATKLNSGLRDHLLHLMNSEPMERDQVTP